MPEEKFHLVAADMGYGHQRAAYPLLDMAEGHKIVTINNYKGIPSWERKYWKDSLDSYEKISKLKKIPILGGAIFSVMDYFQKIRPFYPKRNLAQPTIQEEFFYRMVRKGLGKDLIKKFESEPAKLPILTTFFVAAYFAEYNNYSDNIYCVICDTDASRAWANLDSSNTSVIYLLPSEKVKERFAMYGVPEKNLIVTGFPLPKENVGSKKEIIKKDLRARLEKLDPKGAYRGQYSSLIEETLPDSSSAKRPLTITFAVGGAGAQKETGKTILEKLRRNFSNGTMAINLVAGNRPEINEYFQEAIRDLNLENNSNVRIIFDKDKLGYFEKFNSCLRTTDLLWTKPSELSFYCALGLPIIMTSPVGSQEDFNREWLLNVGAGIDSLDPEYVGEWLEDLLESGRLARAAMDGYLNAEALGTYNIEKIFSK